ncbi:putative recombinase [Cupriavidus basilensis]|uniref:Putative recombinase n=1 Tax=Cupriavidus basilensis TaxID=68895 RepID=A0A0C4YT08_9BURK|nr:putative recombinase [Cupriavidus basilensis]
MVAAHRKKSSGFAAAQTHNCSAGSRVTWNNGKLTGQKPPLKLQEIWAILTKLQMSANIRELAMFL